MNANFDLFFGPCVHIYAFPGSEVFERDGKNCDNIQHVHFRNMGTHLAMYASTVHAGMIQITFIVAPNKELRYHMKMPRLYEPHRGARALQSAHTSALFIHGQYANETSKLTLAISRFLYELKQGPLVPVGRHFVYSMRHEQ